LGKEKGKRKNQKKELTAPWKKGKKNELQVFHPRGRNRVKKKGIQGKRRGGKADQTVLRLWGKTGKEKALAIQKGIEPR